VPKLLFVLSAYLFAWVPANFALLASLSLPSLGTRGLSALVELTAHAIVAVICVVAGWMLRGAHAGSRPIAAAALTTNAVAGIQSLYASALPHDVQPGFVIPLMIVAVVNASAWIAYLYTSKRVRVWLDG
jgi:hypothetical protein